MSPTPRSSTIELTHALTPGWSFGGVVAYEAARQLLTLGFPLRGLLLIDSPFPHDHKALPEAVINHVLGTSNSTYNKSPPPDSHLLRSFKHCAQLLSQYNPPPLSSDHRSRIKTVALRSADTLDTQGLCGVEYGWLERQDVRDEAVEGWKGLVGEMEVLSIEGNHFEGFKADKVRLVMIFFFFLESSFLSFAVEI